MTGYGVVKIHNFDRRTFCEEIGREAWGYIEFVADRIPDDVARQYELTGGKNVCDMTTETSEISGFCTMNQSPRDRSTDDIARQYELIGGKHYD